MADLFDQQGKKIGYTDKNGKVVMFGQNTNTGSSNTSKKWESKSGAQMQRVNPTGSQKFEPFDKIFAWKTTKRDGMISLNATFQKDQKNADGSYVKDGFSKMVIKLKTNRDEKVLFGIFNEKKQILTFEMGNTKCAVNVRKNYFSFIMPEFVKNAKLRK